MTDLRWLAGLARDVEGPFWRVDFDRLVAPRFTPVVEAMILAYDRLRRIWDAFKSVVR